jgi:hypothetical protein
MLTEIWLDAETSIFNKKGNENMAIKKKKKVDTSESLPSIRKKKKKTPVTDKPTTKTDTIDNGTVQTLAKLVKDYFEPRLNSLDKQVQELQKRIDANTDTLKTYKPVLSDIKQVIENMVGVEVTEVKKGKVKNVQVERAKKVTEAKEKKLNTVLVLPMLEDHLHSNRGNTEFVDSDGSALVEDYPILDSEDAAKWVSEKVGKSVTFNPTIKDYINRPSKKGRTPIEIETLKVFSFDSDDYVYCDCADCDYDKEKLADLIDEIYYK